MAKAIDYVIWYLSMTLSIGAVITGILVGSIVVGLIELINQLIAPYPKDLQMGDIEAFRAWVATLPTAAFLIVLLAWSAGAFCGSFITACQPYGPRMILACLVGAVFWVATLFNLIKIPGPIYMWLGLGLVPLMTIAGARLGMKLNPRNPPGPQPYDMREKGMACK